MRNNDFFYRNAETWSDGKWDKVLRDADCFASALGRASARFFLQFMPPGTKWSYWTDSSLERLAARLEGIPDRHIRLRLAEFRRTPLGRATYDAAPADAQRFYARNAGTGNFLDYRPIYDLYRTMDDASWDYILAHAWTQTQCETFAEIRARAQDGFQS